MSSSIPISIECECFTTDGVTLQILPKFSNGGQLDAQIATLLNQRINKSREQAAIASQTITPTDYERLAREGVTLRIIPKFEPVQDADQIWGGTALSQVAPTDYVEENTLSDWSESLQSVLEQPSSTLPQQLIMAGLVFGTVMGFWAWFGTIEEVSQAQGNLIPEGQVYKVQSIAEGEIAELLVEEGESVEAGQVIAELDDRLVTKDIQRLEESLTAKQQQLAQTKVLIEQTEAELATIRSISAADIETKHLLIAQEQAAITTQQTLLELLEQDITAHEARLERLGVLVERGALARDQLFQIEQVLRNRAQERTEGLGAIERSVWMVNRLQAELAHTQASAQKFELEIAQRLQQLQIESTDLIAQVQENETLLSSKKTLLEQMRLVAPVDGTIFSMGVVNPGEVIQPGHTVAEIAPEGAPLVLSAMLPSHEAGLVEVGMEVNMKFEAFPFQEYGIVPGTVQSISPDARRHEQLGTAYQVEVELAQSSVQHEGEVVDLRAGQTASAEVVLRKRRIISLLLDPIRKLQKGGINL